MVSSGRFRVGYAVALICLALSISCNGPAQTPTGTSAFRIGSTAFQDGGAIPVKYTCDGQNISPPLEWQNTPAGTKALALICLDTDVPAGYVHWVIFNIPPHTTALPEAVPVDATLSSPGGAVQGVNSAGTVGYKGPCPPKGSQPHQYHFTLYALDSALALEARASRTQLLNAMNGHIIAQTETIGTFAH